MCPGWPRKASRDRKSTRLNSSHSQMSYAVFCLKKKTVGVGSNPTGVAYDSARGEIFVANQGSNTVSVISASTNAVVATVPVGFGSIGVAYDSARGEIFVANHFSNTVSVISDSTNTVVATVHVGFGPIAVAY